MIYKGRLMNSKECEENYGKYSVLPFNTVMLLETLECMLRFIFHQL